MSRERPALVASDIYQEPLFRAVYGLKPLWYVLEQQSTSRYSCHVFSSPEARAAFQATVNGPVSLREFERVRPVRPKDLYV